MKWIIAVMALALATGCSITAKEPRDELVARNAAHQAEIAVRDVLERQVTNEQRQQFWMRQLLGEGAFANRLRERCGGTDGPCGAQVNPPVYQPPQGYYPQQPVYQPPQPQQPIIIFPSQPQQPVYQPPQPQQQPIFIVPPQSPPLSGGQLPSLRPPKAVIDPPNQYCVWACNGDGSNCQWMCNPVGGPPVSFPLPPVPGSGGDEIANPHFHENKG